MATSTISSNRVAKPLAKPTYTTTANTAPVQAAPWVSPAASGQTGGQLPPDAQKKLDALMQIANSGSAAAPTAKRLADQLRANPSLVNDQNFDTQLQQTIVSYSFGVAGNKIPQPAQDIIQSQVTQPLV